jgi:ATP-dependent DNA helicase RecQ
MESQWNKLVDILNGAEEQKTKITEDFFIRLYKVLNDISADDADKLKACQDALRCAKAHDILEPMLKISQDNYPIEILKKFALIQDGLTRQIKLDNWQPSTQEIDVYKRVKRRFIKQEKIDHFLIKLLKNPSYTHYNGQGQKDAVRLCLTAPDDSTLIINLPTGCGKTLVIHALTLASPPNKLHLVIVPTVGLAIEQSNRVKTLFTKAKTGHNGSYAWYGNQDEGERSAIKERLKQGSQRILFCSPESAVQYNLLPTLFDLAKSGGIGSLIIDEAHLVDQWGSEFRPEFQLLAPLFNSLQEVSHQATPPKGIKKILMSATLNELSWEILESLFVPYGKEAIKINGNYLRPEPCYSVTKSEDIEAHAFEVTRQILNMPRPLILYVTTKPEAETFKNIISEIGFTRYAVFTGKTSTRSREKLIQKWQNDEIDIMIATSAFGVGMDKGNVRSVLHASVPENLDRFYQESGRGGRDGGACLSHLIFHNQQLKQASRLAKLRIITPKLGLIRWQAMHTHSGTGTNNRIKINLKIKPPHIWRGNDSNRAWNIRTLLLMQRTGLIRLYYPVPSPYGDSQQQHNYFKQYFDHIEVYITPEGGGHLSSVVWEAKVTPLRLNENKKRLLGHSVLVKWLKNTQISLCNLLFEYYTTNFNAPEYVCGGCPSCICLGRIVSEFQVGGISKVDGWVLQEGNDIPVNRPLAVYFEENNVENLEILDNWQPLISKLLRNKVKIIRANEEILNWLSDDILLQGPLFFSECKSNVSNRFWPELRIYMQGENIEEFRPTVPTIILGHIDIVDPNNPNRKWWLKYNYTSISQFGINYVNN